MTADGEHTIMANDSKQTTAQTTAPAAPAPAVPPVTKSSEKRTIIFRPPYVGKNGVGSMIANADILGCFGAIPMAIKDFGLAAKDGAVLIYMPSGMYGSRRVGPIGGEIASDADVAAECTTMSPDEAKSYIARHRVKKAAVEALAQSIRDAWASLPADGKFGVPVTMELPAAK